VNSRDLAVIAAEAASDKKADDIIAINIAELLVVTDYFVIATGNTNIQVRAIADEIEEQLRDRACVRPIGREGETEARWVLLDYGDIVVHVFQPEERGFYRLEKLWGDAPRLALPASVVGRAPLGAVDPASADKRAEESVEDEQA
jgi:ribosome-associated protein